MISVDNIVFMKENFPLVWDAYREAEGKQDSSLVEIMPSRQEGFPTLCFHGEDRDTFLHSRYNPLREAQTIINGYEEVEKYKHVIFYGTGLGYHIKEFLVSELSGLSNLLYKAKELNLDINSYDAETRRVMKEIKELENEGFQFEGADASLELLLRKAFGQHADFFQLNNLKIIIEKQEDNHSTAEAVIKVTVGEQTFHTAAEGEGPVNALDNSLRKALTEVYPEVADMHLADYKVRVLNGKEGTAAKVRVLIDSADPYSKWSTVGVSENIIEASWQALVDSINYLLFKRKISGEDSEN
jgi:hypothetical protein